MTGAFFDGSIVANTVELLVLANEPLVVAEAGLEFIGETNLHPSCWRPSRASACPNECSGLELVDAHVGGLGRQIDQHVDAKHPILRP